MFGFVSLGGQKYEAFLWEDAEPEWFGCVILYSLSAAENNLVALHIRVPADRVFIDDTVQSKMNVESTAITNKCIYKLERKEKIGKRVSFCLPNFQQIEEDIEEQPAPELDPFALTEADMEREVELMLARMESGTPRVGGEQLDLQGDFLDGAMLYEAETFGGRMIDDDEIGGDVITQASTIRKHLIEQFLDSPQCSLEPALTAPTFMFEDIPTTSFDFPSLKDEDSTDMTFVPILSKNRTEPFLPRVSKFDELPPESPSLGCRQAAFVSTRGKEKEIWNTYREEITATWRAEIQELRRDLFAEVAHVGA